MKIRVVTTCNKAGFDLYGQTMVDNFARMWPADIRLLHYVEGFDYSPRSDNIELRQLPQWFEAWKVAHRNHADAHGRDPRKNRPNHKKYDYRRDCLRFSHKVGALTDAAGEACDLLIWIDADTIAHEPVTSEWLAGLFPEPRYMAWLDRQGNYPECGFMMFRQGHADHRLFMDSLRGIYENGDVFAMEQTHDSFVIQQLVHRCGMEPFSLSGAARTQHHVFPHSRLGERLDHAKGNRKATGRTPREQVSGRTEAHWR